MFILQTQEGENSSYRHVQKAPPFFFLTETGSPIGLVNNGNRTEWSAIWLSHTRDERAARVRFEITSMISDHNCTTLSSIATLLDQF